MSNLSCKVELIYMLKTLTFFLLNNEKLKTILVLKFYTVLGIALGHPMVPGVSTFLFKKCFR